MSVLSSIVIAGGIGALSKSLGDKASTIIDKEHAHTMKDYYNISYIPPYPIDKSKLVLYPDGKICDVETGRDKGCSCIKTWQCKQGTNCIGGKCKETNCTSGECQVVEEEAQPIGECCQYFGQNQMFKTCPECPCSSYESPCSNAKNSDYCLNQIPYRGYCDWNDSNKKCLPKNNIKYPYSRRLQTTGYQMLEPRLDSYNNTTQCYYKFPVSNTLITTEESEEDGNNSHNIIGIGGDIGLDKFYKNIEYIDVNMYRCDCPSKLLKKNKYPALTKNAALPVYNPKNTTNTTLQGSDTTIADTLYGAFRASLMKNKTTPADLPISGGNHFGRWFDNVPLDISCSNNKKGLNCSCSENTECADHDVPPFKKNIGGEEVIITNKKTNCINNKCSLSNNTGTNPYCCQYYGQNKKFKSCSKCPCNSYKIPCNKALNKNSCINDIPYKGLCVWDQKNKICSSKGDLAFAYDVPCKSRKYLYNISDPNVYVPPGEETYINIEPTETKCDCSNN